MTESPYAAMQTATRFVKAGRLAEATAHLQRMLRGDPASYPGADAAAPADGRIIDVEADEVRVEPPRPAGPRQPEPLRDFLERATTSGLRSNLGDMARPPQGTVPDPLPDGARFLELTHAGRARNLRYRLYVPSGHRDRPSPLLLMLHGCTQSPEDFAAGTRMNAVAEQEGLLVAYPAQDTAANPSRCWSWFTAEDQRRDTGEPALIAGATREILRTQPVDTSRVYVAGLSAGGAMAAIMGRAYPDLFAAVGVHSGLAPGAASDMPSAFAAMRGGAAATGRAGQGRGDGRAPFVPTIVFHGDQDRTVHPRNGEQVIAQVRASAADRLQATAAVQRGRAAGGQGWRRTLHADGAGRVLLEHWLVEGAGHAWSGGGPAGSYTDPAGPDASREMVRFFLEHRHASADWR